MRSEAWRPAAAARNRSPREAGTPPSRHYDLGARSSLHGSGRQLPAVVGRQAPKETEARPREPKTATVERREASVPRHGTQGASAPREREWLFDMVREIVARIERSEIRGRWLPHFAALNAAKLRRAKNQPSRVVGSAPLFPACYLQ
jgi:hypothetical protein